MYLQQGVLFRAREQVPQVFFELHHWLVHSRPLPLEVVVVLGALDGPVLLGQEHAVLVVLHHRPQFAQPAHH